MTITDFPATISASPPITSPSPGTELSATNTSAEPIAVSSRTDHPAAIYQPGSIHDALPGQTSPPTSNHSGSSDGTRAGDQPDGSGSNQTTDDAHWPIAAGPILYDPALYLLAAQLDAIEGLRMATANRHRMATRDVADSDGHMRGLGLTEDNPAVKRSAVMLDALEKTEHEVILGLNRIMRAHPLGPWQKATHGVGEKTLARLLACIGDPYWNTAEDRPRTVAQLWAYCGLHTVSAAPSSVKQDAHTDTRSRVAARRTKGQRANWSTAAKTRVYLIAESCLKSGNYRDIYDDHKARAAAAVHVAPCPQCKEKEAGTPLKPGHQHARAMRAMCKQILKDLWIEARRIHGLEAAR